MNFFEPALYSPIPTFYMTFHKMQYCRTFINSNTVDAENSLGRSKALAQLRAIEINEYITLIYATEAFMTSGLCM